MQKARSHTGLITEYLTSAKSSGRYLLAEYRQMSHSAPTACKYMVSGTISLPSTGFFSFFIRTTSFTIGRQGILSLRRWASLIHTGFHVSDATWVPLRRTSVFAYGTLTLFGRVSQRVPLTSVFLTPRAVCNLRKAVPLHHMHNAYRLTYTWFGLLPFRSPLLR